MRAAFDGTVVKAPYSGVQHSVLSEMEAIASQLGDLSRSLFFCADASFRGRLESRGAHFGSVPRATQRVLLRVFWQQVVLPGILRRSGVDILHALAYTAPLRCPVPYVVNVHDIIALERPDLCSSANRLHMRCLLPGSIRRAAALIVSTHHVADRVQRTLGISRERITVSALGVDFARFSSPASRPVLSRIGDDRPFLLFVGNLEPKKDVGTLLDAYRSCASSADIDLVLAGRAAWLCTDLVERIRAWRAPGRIHWLGRVSGDQLPGLMQHAVAVVMPSIEEGFGMPVLEAMAASSPVIHSDHPALMEAAGGAGVSFPRRNAGALAACIDRLVEDPVFREDLGARGCEWAAAMTWERWGRTAVEVLERVTRGG